MARRERTEWAAEPCERDGEIIDPLFFQSEREAVDAVPDMFGDFAEAEHVNVAAVDMETRRYTYLERFHRDGQRVDLRPKPEPKVQGPRRAERPPVAIGTEIRPGVVYDDGGRRAAGFRGDTGDCVVRAVAIATGRNYAEVYGFIAEHNATQRKTRRTRESATRRSARHGTYVNRKWFREYMTAAGFEFVPTMSIGSGCTVHLTAGELPAGRLVVRVAKHVCAVVDGVIRDTYDPNDRPATLYPKDATDVPAGARHLENGNGWIFEPGPRCVYGYWREVAK